MTLRPLESVHNVLEEVKNSPPTRKLEILKAFRTDPFLPLIFYYTYNPFYRYYIKKVPDSATTMAPTQGWPEFRALLDQLRERSVSGQVAVMMLQRVFACCHPQDVVLFKAMLDRDLGIGVGIQTLLDAYGEDFIPVFEVMKAKKIDDKLQPKFPCVAEPKLDGVRCFSIKNEDSTVLWSRRGHIFENYPQIVQELAEIPALSIFDGELVSRSSFNATMSQVRRKYKVDTSNTLLTIFDGFPLDRYKSISPNSIRMPLTERRKYLEDLLGPYVGNNLELIEQVVVNNFAEAQDYFVKCLDLGYEGIMLKDSKEFYHFRRHKAWLKMKPTETLDLEIVDFQEGEGKYVGLLGAIVVELTVNGNSYRVNVGGGFSDIQRADFWNIRRSLLGTLLEVKYDRVTTNDSGGYSLRFPRFIKLRPDKRKEERDTITI